VVAGLSYAGFDLLSLANNHSGDYGPLALQDTLDYLQAAQIVPLGAGQNLAAAREAKIMWVEGLRVAFLAYDQVGPDWLWATDDAPGCAPMRIDQMAADVQAARRQADVVLGSATGATSTAPMPPLSADAARALVRPAPPW
jgi:poly-gamma-glutamate synthesis protein (capsule biosynthesis protein)